ncbi:MAG: All-trans-phytoene synthase/15-cis-phytoene synthase [Candidatus Erwinia impunctatus]|nr:All-trans-phytoene synthase/15-cis-phytoene synthase [Culicoides impunctatus]
MSMHLLEHATRTIAAGSKSFATASLLFAPATRRSALMLYAWCRHCDDVIDGQTLGLPASSPSLAENNALQRLARLKMMTHRAFSGELLREPAFAAFQEVVFRHNLSRQLAFQHLEGYAMDVRGERFQTLDDTLRYCYHVAGVVGLMMAQIMGVEKESALDRACDLGLAFQLTNIARDIIEDAENNRCYLPLNWLQDAGLSADNYATLSQRPALTRVAQRLLNEAERYYNSARSGISALPLRSAWAVASALAVYRQIGINIRKVGDNAWSERIHTQKLEKIALLVIGAGNTIASRAISYPPREKGLWQRPRG